MRLIGLAVILTVGLTLASLGTAAAQPPEKGPRVGYLNPGSFSDPLRQRRLEAFRQGLRELGYVEGQNIAIESRWAEGKYDRYPALAADLVRLKVDVIVAMSGAATQAAQQATRTIPIVMSLVNDPVGSGLVPSLAHPGGNITGTSVMSPDLIGKQLQLLKEVVPKVSRVAFLRHPANPASAANLREAEAAARGLGVRLQTLEARNPQEIDSAFAAMTREQAGALLIHADALFGNQRRQIAELATKKRLPSIFLTTEYAEAGGLMVYGPNLLNLERRAATYVVKILKGAKPADLPVEQPSKFDLLVNLKTAKALGLTIPQTLLQRADQVIQ
ncbi:MAG: ABC transporter substrate-binding protein [Candidatus Rokuibacteriota bacterium]|nr:MAG: ABC transporter substrate-binding protein [Candidatus Rokubacteria bacterium]